jgi:hypothetical protein
MNMRRLVVGTFLTLDGVMQAPGGPDEDREGGFRHGGWLVRLLTGDVAKEVAKLKALDGDEIQAHGSGPFGTGTMPRAFRLVDTQQTATGAVLHVYERAGGLKYGEVEVGQETVIFDSDPAPE